MRYFSALIPNIHLRCYNTLLFFCLLWHNFHPVAWRKPGRLSSGTRCVRPMAKNVHFFPWKFRFFENLSTHQNPARSTRENVIESKSEVFVTAKKASSGAVASALFHLTLSTKKKSTKKGPNEKKNIHGRNSGHTEEPHVANARAFKWGNCWPNVSP